MAEHINGRTHGTTGAVPAARLEFERRFLAPLPRRRFDTAYAEARRVHVALPSLPARFPSRLRHHPPVADGQAHMDDYAWLDATAQAELVRRREVTPAELVEAALARIDRINPALNAVVTTIDPVPPRAAPSEGCRSW